MSNATPPTTTPTTTAATSATEPLQGPSYIEDVFRRADQNDDQEISLAEFKTFFGDDVMTSEELEEIFNEIESSGDGVIDITEMTKYFEQNSGEYGKVIKNVLKLNSSISECLKSSWPPSQNEKDNFISRFFMRELVYSIKCLQSPLNTAHNALISTARDQRPDKFPYQTVLEGNLGSKSLNKSVQPHDLGHQVERLASLVDSLSCKAKFGAPLNGKDIDFAVLASYDLDIRDDAGVDFKHELQKYIAGLQMNAGCLLSQCVYADLNVVQYEVWRTQADLSQHMASDAYRGFHKSLVDYLAQPLQFKSIATPASWWI